MLRRGRFRVGWVRVGGTTPATCATYARAPGRGSGAQSSEIHFPGSALRTGEASAALGTVGSGRRPEENSGKLGVGDGPGLRLNPTGHASFSCRSACFPSLVWGEKGRTGYGVGPGEGAPGPGQPGLNLFPAGPLAWRRPGPGTTSCHRWAHAGRWAHRSRLVHLQLSLVKVSKLLTLESSFILAFVQLRLEAAVLVESFAFPTGPGSPMPVFSSTTGC